MPAALPVHQIAMDGFWIDVTPVTSEQFEKFVQATGYVTVAERTSDAKDFPDVSRNILGPAPLSFLPSVHNVPLDNHYEWWSYVKSACWRHPEGPGSNLSGHEQHRVVHIT